MHFLLLFISLTFCELYTVKAVDNVANYSIAHKLKYIKTVLGYDIFESPSRKQRSTLPEGLILDRRKRQFKRYWQRSSDPLYASQWHLHGNANSVDSEYSGAYTGKGVHVAIVDDGLQWRHPDLSANYNAALSYDYNGNDADPTPYNNDGHGTSASGVCCAVRNNVCGRGVAYEASLVGVRLIAEATYDYVEAQGLSHRSDSIRIYSCSFGPNDDAKAMVGPSQVTNAVLERNFESGKNMYAWAAGNGRHVGDSANYDGYANSPYTFAIGSIDFNGNQAYYSEGGANLLCVTPSNGAPNHGITTTDLMGSYGYSNGECTSSFGGTSSAAPLAAGIFALILEARPDFTNRDVMHIVAKYSTKVHTSESMWSNINARGYTHSNDFGFGLLKVKPLIDGARNWTLVPHMKRVGPRESLSFIERVVITLRMPHGRRGEHTIKLISPTTTSILANPHGDYHRNNDQWTFTSLRHFGESLVLGKVWRIESTPAVEDVKLEWIGY